MTTTAQRRLRRELQADWKRVKRENMFSALELEVPMAIARCWEVVLEKKIATLAQLAEIEKWIRSEARMCWGEETQVKFDRRTASVVFTHPDGRSKQYGHHRGGTNG